MIHEDALASLRRQVGDAFKAGTEIFPHYTLHGIEHLEELDRLALLLGAAIPSLPKERLNLLRLALILHDFAMVRVPSPAREEELRQLMTGDLTFADIVRQVHQDEIERVFSRPEWISRLAGLFPDEVPHGLEDACTIARHHRLHPLESAPDHVRDLCALMRILDELEIGNRRAPLSAYEAMRSRMEPISRLHWLKHICTRPIERHTTFSVEEKGHGKRILKTFVAVKATEGTWQGLQDKILSKLQRCLEREGVNAVLLSTLQVEIAIEPASFLSGASLFLPPDVAQDLEELREDLLSSKPASESSSAAVLPAALEPRTTSEATLLPASRTIRELKIFAIPPEELPERLCTSGRLTLIGNIYVQPEEENAGGVSGVPSRVYVGPADSGKTRAAMEWILKLTGGVQSQWVVLRTEMGTLPESAENILLDTSSYEGSLPPKAVLFLDDLPLNLPPIDAPFSAVDAMGTLLRWFRDLPYFRERRVVGTLRIEDVHSRPGWPNVLPTLDQNLELIRLLPLDEDHYKQLWEGMRSGATSRSRTAGVEEFQIELEDGFLESAVARRADPEAVATFVQQKVLKDADILTAQDASDFSGNAAQTWLRETWPAVRDAYGLPARVFYSLARFLEAGLRSGQDDYPSADPAWAFHELFGPEICRLRGGIPESYLPTLNRLISDGHASGESNAWIRPRFDFLLQADTLEEVEIDMPPAEWFAERAIRLSSADRLTLAIRLAGSEASPEQFLLNDSAWQLGCGLGIVLLASTDTDPIVKAGRIDKALHVTRKIASAEPELASAWINLGIQLGVQVDSEPDKERRSELLNEEMVAHRRAVTADPKDALAWYDLGVSLGRKAAAEHNESACSRLREEEIAAYQNAIEVDPKYAEAWYNLGLTISQKAEDESDESRRTELREQAIAAYRNAIEVNPKDAQAWYELGVSLDLEADAERVESRRVELREQAIAAYRNTIEVDPKDDQAWYELGLSLELKADAEDNESHRAELREQAITAYRNTIEINPKDALAWYGVGVSLDLKADAEGDESHRVELREQAITAYRKAIEVDSKGALAWNNLGASLGRKADAEGNESNRAELREQAIAAYRKAIEVDPKYIMAWDNLSAALLRQTGSSELVEALNLARKGAESGASRYNLACALARSGELEEALSELSGALSRGEISREYVTEDSDWDHMRNNPRFIAVLSDSEVPNTAPAPPPISP